MCDHIQKVDLHVVQINARQIVFVFQFEIRQHFTLESLR